ncbi:hypothetical protein B0T14DRAFT_511958 [Immersiella caudata]|uniref:Uncharacterized protein n=1 Tax=Immersiella caudata TaxID=314043 RepID=A0AA40C7L9_9PEZI|nr:hypothetical protein B0T14DRAFT_511958 [Immersiella caudata]
MASINSTSHGADNILVFGSYYQTIAAMEPDAHNLHDRKLLHPEEISFIRQVAAYDNSAAAMACQERLSLGIDYYYAVKHQITSVLRLWDAVLDEKRRYDALGRFNRSRSFMDSFQLCSYLIPQRVSIGFLGPYADILVDTTPTLMSYHSAPYPTETSTIFDESEATVVDPAEYDRDGGLPYEEEHPELALSITSSDDNFEQSGFQDEIISISSGCDDSGYGDDDELQFALELEDVVVAGGVSGGNNNWYTTPVDPADLFLSNEEEYPEALSLNTSKGSDTKPCKGGNTSLQQAYQSCGPAQESAAWERFLRRLSETEQPCQGRANREGFAQESLVSIGGAPQPPSSQFGVMKKRKFSAARDRYEEPATSKRSRSTR